MTNMRVKNKITLSMFLIIFSLNGTKKTEVPLRDEILPQDEVLFSQAIKYRICIHHIKAFYRACPCANYEAKTKLTKELATYLNAVTDML